MNDVKLCSLVQPVSTTSKHKFGCPLVTCLSALHIVDCTILCYRLLQVTYSLSSNLLFTVYYAAATTTAQCCTPAITFAARWYTSATYPAWWYTLATSTAGFYTPATSAAGFYTPATPAAWYYTSTTSV